MSADPLRSLEAGLGALRGNGILSARLQRNGLLDLAGLRLEDVASLLADPVASLFLMAAADLNRTALRAGTETPDVQIVAPQLRRAFVVRSKLPVEVDFATTVRLAVQRRTETIGRSANAETETMFKERLEFEGIPIRMQGGWTSGLLIDRRKPDGVFPDPATGEAPRLYLEVKKINRVRDDIQKRLYEIAEVSLEMKFLYGNLTLSGLNRRALLEDEDRGAARDALRLQVTTATPSVVALLICRTEELQIAKRYRAAAEAFIDRVFFADEIEECLTYLASIATPEQAASEE